MNYNKHKLIQSAEINFRNYTSSIKDELLEQITAKKSNSKDYYNTRYDELFYKYVDTINIINYNEVCSKFVRDVYGLIPMPDTI
jgi:hypothetical protein